MADSGVPAEDDLLYLVDVSSADPKERKLTIANLKIGLATPYPPGSRIYDQSLFVTTLNDTPTPMVPEIAISEHSTITFVVYITGRQEGSGVSASYKLEGSVGKHSEPADPGVFSGVFKTIFFEDNADWDATFDVDVVNDTLRILVTGLNADTVNWFAHFRAFEVIA
jgi:hypothetical protein